MARIPRNSVKIRGKAYFLSGGINKTHNERISDIQMGTLLSEKYDTYYQLFIQIWDFPQMMR